jgi:hypothetical protein
MKVIVGIILAWSFCFAHAKETSSHPSDSVSLNDVVADENGVAYVLDKLTMTIYRYDVKKGEYLSALSLESNYERIVYSKDHQRLYLASSSGEISYVDLNSFQKEVSFKNVSRSGMGGAHNNAPNMIGVGPYLVVAHYWSDFWVFDKSGKIISETDWGDVGSSLIAVGNEVIYSQRMGSPSDIQYHKMPGGKLERWGHDSPYHGDHPMGGPIAANKNFVVTEQGGVYDAQTLTRRTTLNNLFSSGIFLSKLKLVTVGSENGRAVVKVWEAFKESQSILLPAESGEIIGEGASALLVYRNKAGLGYVALEDVLSGKIQF